MPGYLSRRKRLSVAVSDDDDQSDVSYSSASKRVRRSDASQGSRSHNDSDHGEDVHQPGSLVRVKLTNFVTYTAAEFHLGPSLNMIIGPNGTGKSTLVCAICLGLGWSPQYLGRAKEIGEFVKHGCEQAEIEIELAGREGERNPIIRRSIRREGNKSMFQLDGRNVTQKEAKAKAESFSIQINNLCQFLPQDRVVEFARMDSVGMLGETLRAAARPQMVAWHEELKQLRMEEKSCEIQQQNEQQHLRALQAKQNAEREDVERYNQRQELVVKANALEKCRPFIQERELKAEFNQIRAGLTAAKEELDQYEADAEPARRAEAEMEVYRDEIAQLSKNRKHRFDVQKGAVERFAAKIDKDQQSLPILMTEIETEKQNDKQRKQDARRLEAEIAGLKRRFEENVFKYDQASFETRLSEIRTKKSAADRKNAEATDDLKEFRAGILQKQDELKAKKDELESLSSQSGQQTRLLAQISQDSANAWRWLQQNMDKLSLKDRVYGPPIIECSLPDSKYADAVENALRQNLSAFTCTNAEDAQIVQNKLLGKKEEGNLGLHNIYIRTITHPRSYYKSPLTPAELERLGFEGYLSDFIEGPDAVMAMLCDSAKIHQMAFTSRSLSDEQYNAVLRNDRVRRWISGSEVFQVTKRAEYGPAATSTSVNNLRKGQYFTGQPVETTIMGRLKEQIEQLEQEIHSGKEVHQEKTEIVKKARKEVAEVDSEKVELQAEQNASRRAHAEWEGLPRKTAAKEAELADIKALSNDTNNRIRNIQLKYENAVLAVVRDTVQYTKEITKLRSLHESLIEAEIRLLEAQSEVDGFKNDNREIFEGIRRQKAMMQQLKADKENKKAELTRMHQQARNILNNASEEEKLVIQEHKELSLEDLDNQVSAVASRLELMADGNPHAIRAYEEREVKIQRVQQTLEETEQKLEQCRQEIKQIRDQWEPELDSVVAQISDGFSHNFQQIGCAGQVGVKKDDDFEKWAIQIEVSFREGEALAILDSHRQSGGERAVSTIFYLMALQGLARSPFRVVDEINQGMDPRNERMVHERMVDIACNERGSQYFLITPKLLNDLKFHPKMKVHCIASGEYMPEQEGTNLNFQSLAEVALRVRKGAIAV